MQTLSRTLFLQRSADVFRVGSQCFISLSHRPDLWTNSIVSICKIDNKQVTRMSLAYASACEATVVSTLRHARDTNTHHKSGAQKSEVMSANTVQSSSSSCGGHAGDGGHFGNNCSSAQFEGSSICDCFFVRCLLISPRLVCDDGKANGETSRRSHDHPLLA